MTDQTTLLAACKTAAEQIRRCDYQQARSTLLVAIREAELATSVPTIIPETALAVMAPVVVNAIKEDA